MSNELDHVALRGLLWAVNSNSLSDQKPHTEALKLAARLVTDGEVSGAPGGMLQSIFCSLHGHSQKQFVPLAKLNPTQRSHLFPIQTPPTTAEKAAAEMRAEVKRQLQELEKLDNPAQAVETALAVLQECAWCLPANAPDVSLFDHARLVAAFTTCLVADERNEVWCKTAEDKAEPVCLLVGGDLSGLQAFIYTLASDGAAKSLRARSFYVQLLTEALALVVLRELGLPLTNALYIGGGGFQLFAPVNSQDKLLAIAQDLMDRLLTLHDGALGLTLHWKELSVTGVKEFGESREQFGQELNRGKRQPFSQASLTALKKYVGQPISQGGDPLSFCRVTGEDGDTVEKLKDEDGRETYRAKFVSALEDLGRQLPVATHIAYVPIDKSEPERATSWQQALQVFGSQFQVVSSMRNVQEMSHGDFVRVWQLKPAQDEDPRLNALGQTPRVISYRPFARLAPRRAEGGLKTFDELAQPVCGGFKRWGVLRMDVDNLGKLFQSISSPARVAGLSFALRLFFEGCLPKLAEGDANAPEAWQKIDLTEHLYIQYSGGDDVFVVGAWDALPEFARRAREAFRAYTTGHPTLTLSAGIALAEEKFPLYQAAELADEAEHAAKNINRADGRQKDAVTFLEQTLGWEALSQAQRRAYTLADLISQSHISRAVLQTILALQVEVAQAKHDHGKVEYGRWMWLAAYQLTRVRQSIKKEHDSAKQEIVDIQNVFLSPDAEATPIKLQGLAARWAQFLTRGG